MSLLTDAASTLKIKTALIMDERLGAATVNVDTLDGVTTLRGHIPSAALRELAEGIAAQNGAREIVNELVVEDLAREPPPTIIPEGFQGVSTPAGAPPSESLDLEATVRAALAGDRRVNAHLIEVQVEDGTVFLVGRQDTVDARDAALEVAAQVPGVVAVINDLTVRPSV